MPGFQGQLQTVGVAPTPLSAGQRVLAKVVLKAAVGNAGVVYYGFYATQALATAGLNANTGFPLESGKEETIDVGALKPKGTEAYGDLKYLFVLSSAGTLSVAWWGV